MTSNTRAQRLVDEIDLVARARALLAQPCGLLRTRWCRKALSPVLTPITT
jgi:hypothetical protein